MKKIYTILTMLSLLCAVSCEDLGNDIFNPNGKPDTEDTEDTEDETQGVVNLAANEIWYTNGSTTDATAPYKTDVFGANIISNTYDSEKECWVIKFDGDVTSIGEEAFRQCSSLASVTIPEGVTSIEEMAFAYCDNLPSITIPNSVTSIEKMAFEGCSSFTSVTIPEGVTSIGYRVFADCTSLASVTIPEGVTSIGEGAFLRCNSLVEFRGKLASEDGRCLIVDGVLNSFAPADLTEYTIPEGVTSIGGEAFFACTSLTSVTIPESVTSIGNQAFSYCSSLTSVYCKPTTTPATPPYNYYDEWDAFNSNASGRAIYVPKASVNAYKTAEGWSQYASDIVGYDF